MIEEEKKGIKVIIIRELDKEVGVDKKRGVGRREK